MLPQITSASALSCQHNPERIDLRQVRSSMLQRFPLHLREIYENCMAKDTARPILSWESENSNLSNIIKKAQILSKLEKAVRNLLPQEIASDCFVSLQTRTRLVIFSQSASTTTRLRYLLPDLLSKLRKSPEYAFISGIDCKVQPNVPKQALSEQPIASRKTELSEKASEHLEILKKTLNLNKKENS